MRTTAEMVKSVADLTPLAPFEIAHLRDAGLIYTDGYVWQLTEAGRKLRKDTMAGAWLEVESVKPVTITPSALTDDLSRQARAMLDVVSVAPDVAPPAPPTTTASPLDSQVDGDHYKRLGQFQPWNVLAHWLTPEELRGYMKGTIIAYLAREQDKGGDTDIEKAFHTGALWQEVRKDK